MEEKKDLKYWLNLGAEIKETVLELKDTFIQIYNLVLQIVDTVVAIIPLVRKAEKELTKVLRLKK